MMKKTFLFFKRGLRALADNAMTRLAAIVALLLCGWTDAFAQGAGAFAAASSEISTYQEPVKKLIYVIAGVIVLVGCFNIFYKMNNGDQDVKKTAMLTIGGCIALVVLANALPQFFNT